MPVYKAPVEDVMFLLNDVFPIERYNSLPGFADASPDVVEAVLSEGAKLCEEVFAPLNRTGDLEGCTRNPDGSVTTPKGFKEAYEAYASGGWMGLAAPEEYGGQGLPSLLNTIMQEFVSSANLSLGMYPGLTQGAIAALLVHGSEEQKRTYLPKMVEGAWTGTMNLTEPHCGTDLGLLKTKAVPNGDGSYAISGTKIFISAGEHDMAENIVHLVLARIEGAPQGTKGISLFVVPKFLVNEDGSYAISGTKIFISAGEHDMAENIVHLVLARIEGAPQGTKGISLFLVPKFMVDDDGSLGDRNGVSCGSLEHKMGIHGNATCVMNYDGAKGWLVGEENRGLNAMFVMMNEARLAVGVQGLAQSELAYQNAVAYAKDRLQGRSLTGPKYPDKPADPIIVHPDVRRTLLSIKAFNEAARALVVWTALNSDIAHRSSDENERRTADDYMGLMTPVVKGVLTDLGFENAVKAQQMFGGHGYIEEWGMSQFVRDARIAMIYEGANGIQAMDLVGRKLAKDGGRAVMTFFNEVGAFCQENEGDEALRAFVTPLQQGLGHLQQATMWFMQNAMSKPDNAGAGATDYMHLFGLVALGYMWAKIAKAANASKAAGGDAGKMDAKVLTGRFFMERMMPETGLRLARIATGADTTMAMPVEMF